MLTGDDIHSLSSRGDKVAGKANLLGNRVNRGENFLSPHIPHPLLRF